MTEAALEIDTAKDAAATDTVDTTKTVETKAIETAKEFVADDKKSDEENAAALAAFEKGKDKTDKESVATIPDNWRELAANGDEDALKLLKRYGSMGGVVKALREKEALIRSGKIKRDMPDPKDEAAVAEWRKAEGIPDDPTGYKLPETITKRLDDADKPILSSFTEFAHKRNAPPAMVELASEWYVEMAEAAQEKQLQSDNLASTEAEDDLRKDWAHGEYKTNLTLGKRYLESVPGIGADWAEARLPNGIKLGNVPEFIRWASDRGREEFGDVAFATGDADRKHTARKEEIEQIMKTDINKYREQGLDKEYQTILDAELKRKK